MVTRNLVLSAWFLKIIYDLDAFSNNLDTLSLKNFSSSGKEMVGPPIFIYSLLNIQMSHDGPGFDMTLKGKISSGKSDEIFSKWRNLPRRIIFPGQFIRVIYEIIL